MGGSRGIGGLEEGFFEGWKNGSYGTDRTYGRENWRRWR